MIQTKQLTGQRAYLLMKRLLDRQTKIDSLEAAIKHKRISRPALIKALRSVESRGLKATLMSKLYGLSLGQVFRFFKENWDGLPKSFTQAYTDGCTGYIREVYGYGDEMADMYGDIWDGWFSGKYKFAIPKFVNVLELPVVKMHQAASYLMRGEMTKRRWRALSNPALTRSELAGQLREGDDKVHPGPKPKTASSHRGVLFWETGDFALFTNGIREHVGQFDTGSTNPLVIAEIRRVAKDARIRVAR